MIIFTLCVCAVAVCALSMFSQLNGGAPVTDLTPNAEPAPAPPVAEPKPAPAGAPAPAAPAPGAPAPTVPPLPGETPVTLADGRRVTLGTLQEMYTRATDLRLDDPSTAAFLDTVSRALRDDQTAIAELQALQAQAQPIAPTAASAIPSPAAPAPSGPAAPSAAAAPGAPGAQPLITAIRGILEPIQQRLERYDSHFGAMERERELTKIREYFESAKTVYPRLHANPASADRVLDRWHAAWTAATRDGAAQPDRRTLQEIMLQEENYLKAGQSAAPAAPAEETTVIRQQTNMPTRIPGRRWPFDPTNSATPGVPQTGEVPVSTTVPQAGPAGPAVSQPGTDQPMTAESLLTSLNEQVRAKGIKG